MVFLTQANNHSVWVAALAVPSLQLMLLKVCRQDDKEYHPLGLDDLLTFHHSHPLGCRNLMC